MRSPVLEWAVKRGRLRYAAAMFRNEEIRPAMRHLKQGGLALVRAGPGHARQGHGVRAVLRRAGRDDHRHPPVRAPERLRGDAVLPPPRRRELRAARGRAAAGLPVRRRDRRQRARQRQHRGDGARGAERSTCGSIAASSAAPRAWLRPTRAPRPEHRKQSTGASPPPCLADFTNAIAQSETRAGPTCIVAAFFAIVAALTWSRAGST